MPSRAQLLTSWVEMYSFPLSRLFRIRSSLDYTDVLTIPMFLESQLLFSRFPKNIGIVFISKCVNLFQDFLVIPFSAIL